MRETEEDMTWSLSIYSMNKKKMVRKKFNLTLLKIKQNLQLLTCSLYDRHCKTLFTHKRKEME